MERTAYTLLKGMESSWWYRGRIRAIAAALAHARVPVAEVALDYGAGYGGMRHLFEKIARTTDALEPAATAREQASERGYSHTFSDEAAAFAKRYDLIGLFDVLEHIEDDSAFLGRARVALEPAGRLVVTVPAFMALWSAHDVEHHHYRRYTVTELRSLLESAGYEVEYVSYWNCLLLIPAAFLRVMGKSGEGGLTPPLPVNAVLKTLVWLEAAVLRYAPLPFGLSIVAVACKRLG